MARSPGSTSLRGFGRSMRPLLSIYSSSPKPTTSHVVVSMPSTDYVGVRIFASRPATERASSRAGPSTGLSSTSNRAADSGNLSSTRGGTSPKISRREILRCSSTCPRPFWQMWRRRWKRQIPPLLYHEHADEEERKDCLVRVKYVWGMGGDEVARVWK